MYLFSIFNQKYRNYVKKNGTTAIIIFFYLFDTCSYWKILVKIFSIRKYYTLIYFSVQFSCSVVSNSVTPWTAARQASLSITNSWSLLKLMSIKSVMPSNHLILCCPLLLPPSIFTSIRVFSNELVLLISWPKYWSFSFSISPSNEYSGLISFGWILVGSPCCPMDSQESPPTPQFKSINSSVLSFLYKDGKKNQIIQTLRTYIFYQR